MKSIAVSILMGFAAGPCAHAAAAEPVQPVPAAEEDSTATLVVIVLEKREERDPALSVDAVVRILGTSIQRKADDHGQVRLPGLAAGETTLQVMLPAAQTCTHVLNVKPGVQQLKLVVSVPSGNCTSAAPAETNEANHLAGPAPSA
jgi:hypothetical protein